MLQHSYIFLQLYNYNVCSFDRGITTDHGASKQYFDEVPVWPLLMAPGSVSCDNTDNALIGL